MSRSAKNNVIELPVTLCRRVEKIAERNGQSFNEAMTNLLSSFFEKEVLATYFCQEGVSHPEVTHANRV